MLVCDGMRPNHGKTKCASSVVAAKAQIAIMALEVEYPLINENFEPSLSM